MLLDTSLSLAFTLRSCGNGAAEWNIIGWFTRVEASVTCPDGAWVVTHGRISDSGSV